MAAFPLGKLAIVLSKQIAKPVSSALQEQCKDHPLLRRGCISLGQFIHRTSVMISRRRADHPQWEILRTTSWWTADANKRVTSEEGYYDCPTERDGSLTHGKKVALLTAQGAGPLSDNPDRGPMQLIEWTERSGKKQQGWIWSKSKEGSPMLKHIDVKVMPDEKALDRGSVFLGESFVFSVAAAGVAWEYSRSQESKRKAKVEEDAQLEEKQLKRRRKIEQNQADVHALRLELDALQAAAAAEISKDEMLQRSCNSLRVEARRAAAAAAVATIVALLMPIALTFGPPR